MDKKILIVFMFIIGLSNVFAFNNIILNEPFDSTCNLDDYWFELARGNVNGVSVVHKFGYNGAIGTSLEPLSSSGTYQTPTTAQNLRAISTSSDDTFNGVGGRTLVVIGLNSSWEEISETVNLNGTSYVNLQNQFIRVYRAYINTSGTYANATAGSHIGQISIEDLSGNVWGIIDTLGGFGLGQTQIGVYTVPKGYTAYVSMKFITVESGRTVDFFMFQRQNANVSTAPYSTMRVIEQHKSIGGGVIDYQPKIPLGAYPEKTDIGFMAKVDVTSASASVDFVIILVRN